MSSNALPGLVVAPEMEEKKDNIQRDCEMAQMQLLEKRYPEISRYSKTLLNDFDKNP